MVMKKIPSSLLTSRALSSAAVVELVQNASLSLKLPDHSVYPHGFRIFSRRLPFVLSTWVLMTVYAWPATMPYAVPLDEALIT